MKPQLIAAALLLLSITAKSQIIEPDSTHKLKEVTIRGYYNPQILLRSVSAVSLIDSTSLQNQQNSSLVSTFNTVPGVRMEERSPGSYRLSLRGSLLRSPFGIRNIKIYIDDFPLTDAGGNTYLNALDISAIAAIEIYKGPEASIFGASTGGTVLLNPRNLDHNSISASLTAGSYGLFHQSAEIVQRFKNYSFSFNEGIMTSDGYRQNSAIKRNYFQTFHQWDYSPKGRLKAFVFYSDLNYQTPGGLTASQLEQNPELARPQTNTLPGAITQKAAIYNQTIFSGISNTYQFDDNFKHVVSLFSTYTDFKNPFITNYEKRYESTFGLRTFLDYSLKFNDEKLNVQLGLESAKTQSQIKNFDNNGGEPGAMQAADDLGAYQNFAFLRFNLNMSQKLLLELASSVNFYHYQYESFFPNEIASQKRNFKAQFMPKIAASYLLSSVFSLRASVSKGYAAPTIAEVRSSDNNINNNLQAEYGWNYEFGFRYKSPDNGFYFNGSLFKYHLTNAIVRRLNSNDTEYFINAGGTKQTGLELETALWIFQNNSSWLKGLQWKSNYTYSHFRFDNYAVGSLDFSGNKLTGVPGNMWLNSLDFQFKKGLYLFAQHNYTDAIPLNDANTVFAGKYHLIELKTGVRNIKIKRLKLDVFLGLNNLLNQNYSLGNDLNAANGRYFNPAAGRNFYAGLTAKF